MSGELLINITDQQTRVALMEHGVVTEFHLETARKLDVVGNIYKGRVLRVLPGLQAAFLEIGLERAAFLYVTDIMGHFQDTDVALATRGDNGIFSERPQEQDDIPTIPIEKLLREGQELLVQVAKGPLGGKGARVSNYISLPGRHLVFMPDTAHIGVSRRIEDEEERRRLRELTESLRPDPQAGFIVRTMAEGMDEGPLRSDVEFLTELWERIRKKEKESHAPSLIHSDLSITLRALRDLLTDNVKRVLVDRRKEYEEILALFGEVLTSTGTTVELYDDAEPIFERFGLEMEINHTLKKKVWLKSGGYIVIEQTEALTSIDVNTGRYVGKRNFEETILDTNLEALREICHQLRLRNIGGIIVIDFIDMAQEPGRQKVYDAFLSGLKNDKARTNVLPFSEFGLIEMTRKRTRDNIMKVLSDPCPYCESQGFVRSRQSVCADIFRRLPKEAKKITSQTVALRVHPDIAELLNEEERLNLEEMELRLQKQIVIKDRPSFHIEQYEIVGD